MPSPVSNTLELVSQLTHARNIDLSCTNLPDIHPKGSHSSCFEPFLTADLPNRREQLAQKWAPNRLQRAHSWSPASEIHRDKTQNSAAGLVRRVARGHRAKPYERVTRRPRQDRMEIDTAVPADATWKPVLCRRKINTFLHDDLFRLGNFKGYDMSAGNLSQGQTGVEHIIDGLEVMQM